MKHLIWVYINDNVDPIDYIDFKELEDPMFGFYKQL